MINHEDNILKFEEISNSITRDGWKDLVKYLLGSTFFEDPASTKYHNAIPYGLLDHTLKMHNLMAFKNKKYKLGISEETIAIVAICHDLCKIGTYSIETRNRKNDDGKWESYSFYNIDDTLPLGHGQKSLYIALQYIKLTEEEAAMILWHMGKPADFVENLSYSAACKKYPGVVITHTSDFEAAYLFEVQGQVDL